MNIERKKREVQEEAFHCQLEEVKATQRSNKDKHETMEWQLDVRLTREKEGREEVEKEKGSDVSAEDEETGDGGRSSCRSVGCRER